MGCSGEELIFCQLTESWKGVLENQRGWRKLSQEAECGLQWLRLSARAKGKLALDAKAVELAAVRGRERCPWGEVTGQTQARNLPYVWQ